MTAWRCKNLLCSVCIGKFFQASHVLAKQQRPIIILSVADNTGATHTNMHHTSAMCRVIHLTTTHCRAHKRILTHCDGVSILIFAMATVPVASIEAARLRCQKSGCREGSAAAEEPALIVQSPTTKVFPLLASWIAAFLVLRLGAHYVRRLIPIIRRKTPEIVEAMGHYYNSSYDSLVHTGAVIKSKLLSEQRTTRRVKSGRRQRPRKSSNTSLGSLADLLDDSIDEQSSRGSSLWYDSSSAGYSSAYTGYTSDSNYDDDKSSALESQSEIAGLSILSSESSTDSTHYDYSHDNDDQSRGGGRHVVSKFLNYISESKPGGFLQQYHAQMSGGGLVKRRPSLEYSVKENHIAVGGYGQREKGTSSKRRSTVDEMIYPSYLSQISTTESNNQRREITNVGVKQRKAAAKTQSKRQYYGNSDYHYETKTSKRQQQQQIRRHGKEEQSGLRHHLSKFSSPSEDDYENYSTMLSVDLRSWEARELRGLHDRYMGRVGSLNSHNTIHHQSAVAYNIICWEDGVIIFIN